MDTRSVALLTRLRNSLQALGGRLRSDVGEGVISTAIAVLIVAILGATVFAFARDAVEGANQKAQQEIDSIGS